MPGIIISLASFLTNKQGRLDVQRCLSLLRPDEEEEEEGRFHVAELLSKLQGPSFLALRFSFLGDSRKKGGGCPFVSYAWIRRMGSERPKEKDEVQNDIFNRRRKWISLPCLFLYQCHFWIRYTRIFFQSCRASYTRSLSLMTQRAIWTSRKNKAKQG